jgi:putative phage-type endonuclease
MGKGFSFLEGAKVLKPKTFEEWLAINRRSIGGSKIATILGLNMQWHTPYQLWREMKGLEQPQPTNFAMKLGTFLEDGLCKLWQEETGIEIIKVSAGNIVYVHPDYDFIAGTPDRRIWLPGETNQKGILEAKTTMMRISKDDFPMSWYCQLQMYMGLTGYKKGYVVWLELPRRLMDWQEFDFDQEFFDHMVDQGVSWYNKFILGEDTPALVNSLDVLMAYRSEEAGLQLEADEELELLYSSLVELKADAKAIDTNIEQYEEKVKLRMLDAEYVTSVSGKLFTFKKQKDGISFDTKRLIAEQPDIVRDYGKAKIGARVFRIVNQ